MWVNVRRDVENTDPDADGQRHFLQTILIKIIKEFIHFLRI